MTRILANACPNCGADMVLRSSKYGPFYGCRRWPQCNSTHGAHPDGRPLGIPADKATKDMRIRAHAAFDPIWKGNRRLSKKHARGLAYRWLQRAMNLAAWPHIGEFSAAQCAEVIRLCGQREVLPRRLEWWEFVAVEAQP